MYMHIPAHTYENKHVSPLSWELRILYHPGGNYNSDRRLRAEKSSPSRLVHRVLSISSWKLPLALPCIPANCLCVAGWLRDGLTTHLLCPTAWKTFKPLNQAMHWASLESLWRTHFSATISIIKCFEIGSYVTQADENSGSEIRIPLLLPL